MTRGFLTSQAHMCYHQGTIRQITQISSHEGGQPINESHMSKIVEIPSVTVSVIKLTPYIVPPIGNK